MKILRKLFRWIALGVVVTAIVMALAPEQESVPPAASANVQVQGNAAPAAITRAPPPLRETVHVELERLAHPQADAATDVVQGELVEGAETAAAEATNVFGAISWYVPPPPPPPMQPVAPPPPSAPPLPFIYLGRYEDAPTRLAILVNGERMYTVAEGAVIESTYRVERVTDSRVDLIYLPLNIRQTLGSEDAL